MPSQSSFGVTRGVVLELLTEGRMVHILAEGFDAGVRLREAVPRPSAGGGRDDDGTHLGRERERRYLPHERTRGRIHIRALGTSSKSGCLRLTCRGQADQVVKRCQ